MQACALPSSTLQLTDADRSLLVELYTELQQKYPHSATAKRIPLAFLQGDAFHTALDAYLKVCC
jgi:NMDA receptor-regulated protein 1